jgi:hypothetical protein
MKIKKDPFIRVHICWEVGEERKCATISKEEAYTTRNWVEKNKGVVWWFQAVN